MDQIENDNRVFAAEKQAKHATSQEFKNLSSIVLEEYLLVELAKLSLILTESYFSWVAILAELFASRVGVLVELRFRWVGFLVELYFNWVVVQADCL